MAAKTDLIVEFPFQLGFADRDELLGIFGEKQRRLIFVENLIGNGVGIAERKPELPPPARGGVPRSGKRGNRTFRFWDRR